ncbi:uncharacterized protein LOC141606242 [Silene latifolia]|uniref:uncharacterized protein LOC141606242 n=1 Tax=Silene latifolia TaxID=37657 RepID=UPI003D7711F6
MAAVEPSPSLEILVREQEGFSIWTGPPFEKGEPATKLLNVACKSAVFSEDGSRLMVIKPEGVISVFDCKTYKEIKSIHIPELLGASLSPRGTYVQTFQKASVPQEKNVNLWKVDTAVSVYTLSLKHMSKSTWPAVSFSSDETIACRLATNEVQYFDPSDFSKGFVSRLRVPGVAAVQLSRLPCSHIATYVPESKGVPASIQIYACGKDASNQPLARRSFFRCSTVQFYWNHGSTGVLAVAQSEVDKTNQSYYGESKLNYLTTDGTHEGLVPLRKDGPIHDVQWSNSGLEFAVVYGFMPAKATVFDKKCKPIFELGEGPYNTVKWNPKGRFLCLAGFGNLPGDMTFWDCKEKKLLGTTKAEWSVTYEWSPNGCYFMTASTAPRRQVDNGMKIFHHNGSLLFQKTFDKLFQAEWKPESADRFGDIAELGESVASLKIEDAKSQGQGSKSSKAAPKATSVNVPQKPAAYRPPHAKQAAVAKVELFGGMPSQELSKNALKNKKKREKQREKKASEGSSADS